MNGCCGSLQWLGSILVGSPTGRRQRRPRPGKGSQRRLALSARDSGDTRDRMKEMGWREVHEEFVAF